MCAIIGREILKGKNEKMKKALSLILALIILTVCLASCVSTGDNGSGTTTEPEETTTEPEETTTVTEAPAADTFTLRIEGNDACLFEGEVTFSVGETLQKALLDFDANNNDITFKGTEDNYISEINGEAAAKFGGWDGWLFLVNGKMSEVGIGDVKLAKDDTVVFFYGDPYGANGFLFPEYTVSEGKITFTYDNAPIEGMTVTLNGKEYKTDATGSITCEAGKYTMQISKYAESGLALVLRLPENTSVEVK